ncbi:NAD(P)H-binding protein [Nocardia huaxiensis]|uniref:NmrA family NAD(P)-binding protein n=1 Tax=Nocardia huaxiensis TaxID=2755382 RepID=A0A7D6ZPS4_9NOCA|nr:NAD(P)H-binding protein [Nocardia huaxiensis]QLY32363.1 NmrA family NAD(P)-binding protein [Nocardia huaxiensis]UFS93927.1 NAD(P)H-binding protein [Nocardia huaxiensis]
MYLVVGATAHFGRDTVDALHAAGLPVRGLTRQPESAGLPAGVAVAGDLTSEESLVQALSGVEAIFLVLQYGMDVAPLLAAAQRTGVRRIVFLSSGAVVDGDEPQPDVIAEYHRAVERAVEASGIEWTFLRLLFPAINSLTFAMQLAGGDVIRAAYGAAAASVVHEKDVAAVAVAVLAGGHAGQIYNLTGPDSLTQVQQVEILGQVLGRPLTFEELDDAPVREQMAQFMDPAFINALFDLMAVTVGKPAEVNDVVERLTGRAPRGYAEWVADHLADFS